MKTYLPDKIICAWKIEKPLFNVSLFDFIVVFFFVKHIGNVG